MNKEVKQSEPKHELGIHIFTKYKNYVSDAKELNNDIEQFLVNNNIWAEDVIDIKTTMGDYLVVTLMYRK